MLRGAQRYLPLYLITSPFESEFHLYPGQYGGTIQPTETVGFSPGNKILLEQVFLG